MDKKKREELKEKRKQLQKELCLKEKRDRLSSEIAHLERSGHSFQVYYAYEHLNWIAANVQVRRRDGYNGIHGDFQVDVDDSEAEDSIVLQDEDINSETFVQLFLSLISKESMLVVCHQGGDPELEISVAAFLSEPNIFFSSPETWILSSDKKWIIEYLWDQGGIRFIQLQDAKPILIKKLIIE